MPSSTLKRQRHFHEGLVNALLSGQAELLNIDPRPVRTRLLIFRHPSTIQPRGLALPDIEPEHVILVVNHPPVNAHGRIDYILPYAVKAIREKYGLQPKVYPIGPLVRYFVEDVYGDAVRFENSDWNNVFDVTRFSASQRSPRFPLRVGRHSRPGSEKWPDTPEDILNAYPEVDGIEVRVLGGAQAPESVLGRRPKNWTVYEFGAVPAEVFLQEIDVFVYFHHPRWVEAFGRVIVEAMASGLPVIVPHHFEPLFGSAVLYSEPVGVMAVLDRLKDVRTYAAQSALAAAYARRHFSQDTHTVRLDGIFSTARQ